MTRPGSGFMSRSRRANCVSNQPVTDAISSAGGTGSPLGGIWPVRSFCTTFSQTSRSFSADLASRYPSRLSPPTFSFALWQRTQLLLRNGSMPFSKEGPAAREADGIRHTRASSRGGIFGLFTSIEDAARLWPSSVLKASHPSLKTAKGFQRRGAEKSVSLCGTKPISG